MKRTLSFLVLALLVAAPRARAVQDEREVAALPDPEQVMMLRLRDGRIRWGAILEHSADGFRFQSLDDGGLAQVEWPMLDPRQEEELRERFGYVDVSAEELYVDAERLLLVDGREVTGVILSRDGDHYMVKVDGQLQMVPKKRVSGVAKGERLPALDVYTREELYGMFAAEADLEDAASQLELAQRCEQILDFEHAVTHYAAALELSQDEQPDVAFALARAEEKAKQQAQVDYLREVDVKRKREKFDEALEDLAAFPGLYPGSPLLENARKATERVLLDRDDALRDLVRHRWDYWARLLSRKAGSELSYQAALAYAEEGLGQEIRKRVHQDVVTRITKDVMAEQIEQIWAARKRGAYKRASFGYSTWLLGEDRARAGIDSGAEEQKTGVDAEREKLQEKIERFMAAQRAQRRSQTQKEAAEESETYWASLSGGARGTFIHAYYVEFGGDFELYPRPTFSNCPGCAGTGVREVLAVGGGGQGNSAGVHLVTCGTCHGSGVLRKVRYR